ncbi:hypothetical protein [Meiothermus phage MMP17]|nr:hypothetical protein [Meiothermus phage MMP17]
MSATRRRPLMMARFGSPSPRSYAAGIGASILIMFPPPPDSPPGDGLEGLFGVEPDPALEPCHVSLAVRGDDQQPGAPADPGLAGGGQAVDADILAEAPEKGLEEAVLRGVTGQVYFLVGPEGFRAGVAQAALPGVPGDGGAGGDAVGVVVSVEGLGGDFHIILPPDYPPGHGLEGWRVSGRGGDPPG